MLEYPHAPAPEPAPPGAPAPSPSSEPGPSPLPQRVVPPRQGSSRATIALYAVAAVVAIGGLAFAAGRMTAPVAAANAGTGFERGAFPRGSFAPGANFVPGEGRGAGIGGLGGGVTLTGTVESVSASSMTVRTASGQTVTVDLAGTTTYHRQAAASSSDVTAGSSVKVQVEFAAGGGVAAGGGQGGAAPSPQASGARTFTASDVTLVNP